MALAPPPEGPSAGAGEQLRPSGDVSLVRLERLHALSQRKRPMRAPWMRFTNSDETYSRPGSSGDAARLLRGLAGVVLLSMTASPSCICASLLPGTG